MTKFKNTNHLLPLIIILMSQWTVAFGQKLPKIQTAGVWAPQTIKIDGQTTEWNNQFQAYNVGNSIYYTVSNDDNNLYLTARMEGMLCTEKIFRGGLTFTIITLSQEADRLSITFPVIAEKSTGEMERPEAGPLYRYSLLKPNEIANEAKTGPLVSLANNAIKKYKEIHVKGIPGISDPLLSIYNTENIKVGASFDKSMRYTYELAIPLKYLEAAINDIKSLKYNIKLRWRPNIEAKSTVQPSNQPVMKFPAPVAPPDPFDQFLYNDTDFSGEYTLASKL